MNAVGHLARVALGWSLSAAVILAACQPQIIVREETPVSLPTLGMEEFADTIQEVAGQITPAVVHISRQFVVNDPLGQPFTRVVGLGSGVIYDQAGYVLTNAHVVGDGDDFRVGIPDGRSVQGTLAGSDQETDLAVLKLPGSSWPVAEFGDSTRLHVGDWVIAIGNAYGLEGGPTTSAGIVSAVGRSVAQPTTNPTGPQLFLFDLLQTDAAISPGNSGGPLVNLHAEVVGINTLANGEFGLAIPSEQALAVAGQLIAKGRVTHPYLGIDYVRLDPFLANQLSVGPQQEALLVRSVETDSSSERAGVRPSDLITALNGAPVATEIGLAGLLRSYKPGETVALTVIRNGQAIPLNVTLGERR